MSAGPGTPRRVRRSPGPWTISRTTGSPARNTSKRDGRMPVGRWPELASQAAGPPADPTVLERMRQMLASLEELKPLLRDDRDAQAAAETVRTAAIAHLDEVLSNAHCEAIDPDQLSKIRGRWFSLERLAPTRAQAEIQVLKPSFGPTDERESQRARGTGTPREQRRQFQRFRPAHKSRGLRACTQRKTGPTEEPAARYCSRPSCNACQEPAADQSRRVLRRLHREAAQPSRPRQLRR